MTLVTLPGGETIWYKVTGDGAPLLHIHGSAFGHRNFEKMTPLSARDFAVIDFDLPGYGESTGSPRPGGMLGIAEQVFELIEAIGPELGFSRVSIHGTSFGAMIALTLAAHHPEVIDRLVLSCFLARYDNAARMMRATWKRAARDSDMTAVADLTSVAGFARGFYDRPEAQAQLEAMRVAFSATTAEAFIAGTETIEKTDLSPLLPRITMPVMLLAGAEDNMTAFDTAPSGFGLRKISEALSNAELHVIPDSGHYLVIEQPELAAEKVAGFLKR
ncbi:alpha/beta hydrolase [Sphingomonas sp. AR_OL41]|uniref:alpha/beta fold hydrolase n=1 Tax=Sphingomonas sp. AR_OL41 TaxID=3042729 RepID=UPI00248043E7|nr:alpha/beta hydrolase [Sphingomonas sp. AR_OL41]MDH7973258.1 alpha/beta hydrolase [Sphingomonas sp. AR_OL41]